ncbi:MAG: YceI family protein [Bacteroidota bacterium]|nr:YceI family protein [Flavisolibacter sp.]MDQ3844988.1 YceI family protein [Bacteroidota bacterium]MBD0285677.1 YceI family protein [Flavisolibacter sp.]MBD0298204.1 YceI family protein [Flavisolibacter sp.]MBD0351289.1 YceI family protein [Flavisolibacter sp.]
MNKIFLITGFLFIAATSWSQDKYFTKSGKIDFYSVTPLEDIAAKNKSAVSVLDAKTGTLHFSVLIKGFEFKNEEMQEHFNENYMESAKYPKAEFKGQILNNALIDYKKSGSYPVQVKGLLTLHGVTKEVQTTGIVKVDGGSVKAASAFTIQIADYGITIPKLVRDKVAKTVKIVVDTQLDPLKG